MMSLFSSSYGHLKSRWGQMGRWYACSARELIAWHGSTEHLRNQCSGKSIWVRASSYSVLFCQWWEKDRETERERQRERERRRERDRETERERAYLITQFIWDDTYLSFHFVFNILNAFIRLLFVQEEGTGEGQEDSNSHACCLSLSTVSSSHLLTRRLQENKSGFSGQKETQCLPIL